MWRRWSLWLLAWLAMLALAWVYAGRLTGPSTAGVTVLPLELTGPPTPTSPLHPVPARGASSDPFAPEVGGRTPQASPPEVLPPPPVPLPPPPPPEPAAPPAPAPAPTAEVPFKLTGVVKGAANRAILEVNETAYIVKEGDTIEDWTVLRIESRRVILRSPDGQEVALELGG